MFVLLSALSLAAEPAKVELQPVGEVRVDLLGMRLDRFQQESLEPPVITFWLERGRFGLHARYGDSLRSYTSMDISQSFAQEVRPGGESGPRYDELMRVRMMDAYLEVDAPFGQLKVGQQYAAFGNVDSYGESLGHFVPGNHRAGPRRMGLLPNRVIGLTWKGQFGHLTSTAQVFGLQGAHAMETDLGKATSLRLSYALPQPGLSFSVSGLAGPGEGEAVRVLYDGIASFARNNSRAFLEGFGGQGLGSKELGAVIGVAQDVPLQRGSLDRLGLVARVSWFDYDLDTESDESLNIDVASNLWYGPFDGGNVMTGLAWRTQVPMDAELAIEHQAVLQLRLDF